MKLPRFSLRELFLLVVIASMGCGWWVDRKRLRDFGHLWQARADSLQFMVENYRAWRGGFEDDELTVNWEGDTVSITGPDQSGK